MAYIVMASGAKVFVDDADFAWLNQYKWCLTAGYPSRRFIGKVIYLHHFLIGCPLTGLVVDHIDRDKLNNSRSNLRVVTQMENMANSRRAVNRIGVSVDRRHNRFKAYIDKPGFPRVNLGTYRNYEDALAAVTAARRP